MWASENDKVGRYSFCTILGKILVVKDACIFLRRAKLRKDHRCGSSKVMVAMMTGDGPLRTFIWTQAKAARCLCFRRRECTRRCTLDFFLERKLKVWLKRSARVLINSTIVFRTINPLEKNFIAIRFYNRCDVIRKNKIFFNKIQFFVKKTFFQFFYIEF